jgi:hypothetical protein
MRHAARKGPARADAITIARHNDLVADFIRIELELADTFCKLALESHSPERTRQHTFNARRALDAAFHALTKAEMQEKELEGMITRIEEVKALVESIEAGGRVHPSC